MENQIRTSTIHTHVVSEYRSSGGPTTETTIRTEDGCVQTLPNSGMVKAAKRWAPDKTRQKEVYLLDPGDYIDTAEGWSSIVEISRQ